MTAILHSELSRIFDATLAISAFASLLSVTLLPLNVMLGRSPMLQRPRIPYCISESITLQQSGGGHLPTPSASTGWHCVGVISSLSFISGTPSPSVSRLTPCESTGDPA